MRGRRGGGFLYLTEVDWQDGFALTFHGYVRITREAWLHLRASNGSIPNIARIGSRAGPTEFTTGGAVSIALLNFTKTTVDIGIKQGV
jgi:hypothetical protein